MSGSKALILTLPPALNKAVERLAKKRREGKQAAIVAALCEHFGLEGVAVTRGRPVTKAPPDPNAPKKKIGRPRKTPAVEP